MLVAYWHFSFTVKDIDRSVEFYTRVVGMKLVHTQVQHNEYTAKLVAYVQGRDHEGQTALFPAAEAGWDRVTKYLLDHGADPHIRDNSGKLALDYAKAPPPVGPGFPPNRADPSSRARTVALLAALVPAASPGTEVAAAK